MKAKLYKIILTLQGVYYILTGAWALIHSQSFSSLTQYQGDIFLKYTNGLLFFVLGLLMIYASRKPIHVLFGLLIACTCISIAAIEFLFLVRIGNPLPFWLDFFEEATIGWVLLFVILFHIQSTRSKRKGLR